MRTFLIFLHKLFQILLQTHKLYSGNAIKSLKSNYLLSIHIPILCKNRGQPPCNTVVLLNHTIINIYLQHKKVRNIFNIIAYFFYS